MTREKRIMGGAGVAGRMGMLAVWAAAGVCAAATLRVPSQYSTVQAAIDAAAERDEVVVAPGRYVENIQMRGKNIVLRSEDPLSTPVVAATILESDSGSVVTFGGTETEACLITGLTITGGLSGGQGGGILGNGTHARIIGNRIVGNSALFGGGVYGCDGQVSRNEIRDNYSYVMGAGIQRCDGIVGENIVIDNECRVPLSLPTSGNGGGIYDCDGIVECNWVEGNLVSGGGSPPHSPPIRYLGYGAGISACDGIVRNNIVIHNNADVVGGIGWCAGFVENNIVLFNAGGGCRQEEGVFRNNIVFWNTAPNDPQMPPVELASYNCIQDWPTTAGLGNINADPRFVDAMGGDFRLLADSPCIDAGGAAYEVLEDFEGSLRPLDGVADSPPRGDGSGWDIGAFEYPGSLLPLPAPPRDLIRDVILKRFSPRAEMDLNHDGVVDAADLVLALAPGT